ncbi:MAG: DUF1189 family protein [Alphaproteobacteria bacterium]|nr:DUF1189 family protein [Alphaproteobacteria bacterium]
MNKILNYIKNGKGCGLKFLLLYSLILSIIFGIEIKVLGDNFVPEMQSAAEKLLPVKIENGTIIEPNNEIKSVNLNFGGVIFPLVLDTTVDTIDPIGLNPGIYIARKALYSVSEKDIRVIDFQENMDLLQGNYTDLFKKIVWFISIITVFIAWIMPFVGYTLCAVLYAFCGQFIAKVKKLSLDFAAAMRLAVVAYLPTLLIVLALNLVRLHFSFWFTSTAVLLLEYIIVSAMLPDDKQEKPKGNKENKKG